MPNHITHDSIYDTVDRDDFQAMIEVDRYGDRSDAFDAIISVTVDHFWDPMDPAYLDFSPGFDTTEDTILPREMCLEPGSQVWCLFKARSLHLFRCESQPAPAEAGERC